MNVMNVIMLELKLIHVSNKGPWKQVLNGRF